MRLRRCRRSRLLSNVAVLLHLLEYTDAASISTASESTASISTTSISVASISTASIPTATIPIVLHSTASHPIASHSTALRSTALHSTALHSTVSRSTISQSRASGSTVSGSSASRFTASQSKHLRSRTSKSTARHSSTASHSAVPKPTGSLPIPAAVLRTWTGSGSPLLHIQPAFHHKAFSPSIAGFKAVFLAEDGAEGTTAPTLDDTLLLNDWSSNSTFSQDVAGIEIPNLLLPSNEAMVVFARDPQQEANSQANADAGDVWAMTFPGYCRDITNASLADYKLWRSSAGQAEWQPIDMEMRKNLSIWFPSPRYLGRSFTATLGKSKDGITGNHERLYSFGGVCASGAHFSGNTRNDSFSAEVWRFENATAGEMADVDIAISKNPPIPEAGFSMTPLPIASITHTNSTNGTGPAIGHMLILGGYTSLSRFVGLGQLAIYSLAREAWSFVSATVTEPGITPRAGHSAVLDESGGRIVLFGGWVGNTTNPADPQMLSLKIGDIDGGWEWESIDTTEEAPGVGPGDMPLWGHAAILLEGNIMLVTSGFKVTDLDSEGKQTVNERTFFLNLTSNTWIPSYNFPVDLLARTVNEVNRRQNQREVGILAGVFGGVVVLVAILTALFCYAKRKEQYTDLPRNEGPPLGDKYHSLDLEYGKDIIVDGVPPIRIIPPQPSPDGASRINQALVEAGGPLRGADLPPRPAAPPPTHAYRSEPSHMDQRRMAELQERQEQLETLIQQRAEKRRSGRSVRSEMVAWVREWANADAAAHAADVMQNTQDPVDSTDPQQKQFLSVGRAERSRSNKDKGKRAVSPETRCITGSSVYSEGEASTLTASEIYDTPVEEVPYPVPPVLLSKGEEAEAAPRQHPRVLVGGSKGVTTPLPKRMAEEFPVPTVVPRDSLVSSAGQYSSPHNSRSFSASQPLLPQSRNVSAAKSWRDVTPPEEHTPFYAIPLTASGDVRSREPSKTLDDRVREAMLNPGPARTEEECRLSSIMNFYTDSVPQTPVTELADDEDEDSEDQPFLEEPITPRNTSGERAVSGGKSSVRSFEDLAFVAPIKPLRKYSPARAREPAVMPLLSKAGGESSTAATLRVENPDSHRSRMPSIGQSIRKRMDALLADKRVHSEKRVPSGSLGRSNVLHRRPQTSAAGQRPGPLIATIAHVQPQKAEIVDIEPAASTPFLSHKDTDDSSMSVRMDDKDVQFLYTAPRGKLRVVNPSERRFGSGGTESSGLSQGRVGSGARGIIPNGESITRMGSAAARRFGELD
ncbi:hypothetical protein ABW21_db0201332 [Orbilia brochopaga]|nr:hypothetical protein ABW21_db0201332 [Drechslerella brochopaga]